MSCSVTDRQRPRWPLYDDLEGLFLGKDIWEVNISKRYGLGILGNAPE